MGILFIKWLIMTAFRGGILVLSGIFRQTESIKQGIEKAWANNQVIANNIANAETAGFKAKKINDSSFKSKITNENARSIEYNLSEKEDPANANGNNVNLEQEMSDLLKNNIAYEALIRKVTMELNRLEYAINEGRK